MRTSKTSWQSHADMNCLWALPTLRHSENSLSKCLRFGVWKKWNLVPLSQSALVTCLWKRSGCIHGMGLLLQEKAQRDHSGICLESHIAETVPVFLILIKVNQMVQTVEKLFALRVCVYTRSAERKDLEVWSIKTLTAFKVRWKVQPPQRTIVPCYQRAQTENLLLSAKNLSWTGVMPPERLFAQFCFNSYCLDTWARD